MKNIQTLLQIQGLCAAIGQGAVYLEDHPENSQVRSDMREALGTLRTTLLHFVLYSEEVSAAWTQMESLLAEACIEDAEQLTKGFYRLLSAASHEINRALSIELKDIPYIERSIAEDLFAYLRQVPHDHVSVYKLMMEVCAKCVVSAPMESFRGFMQMFEEQPGLLSDESWQHPGYVYRHSDQHTFEICPICGGTGLPYHSALSYRMSDFNYPSLPAKLWMKCGTCANLYTWKFPEERLAISDRLELVLPDKTRCLTTTGTTNAARLSVWSDVLNRLQAYTNKRNTLLEVGVGYGELLAVALEMGYDVDAVEIYPPTARTVADMLNIPVWNMDFLKYNTEKRYAVIIMGDVIEHVIDPRLALRQAHRLLDEDGVLWLSTPNYESSFSMFSKFNDPMWCEPGHITYFSRRGLEWLASECGFVVREYHVSKRYQGSMELILTKETLSSDQGES